MSGRRVSEQTFTQSFFFHLMHAIARAHASTCTTSLLTYLLLIYYPVYCPSFPWQRGLDSVTCLNGLTAFLHLLRSWTVDNRSLSRSLLMLSNHFLGCPEGSYHLLRNLRSFWAIIFHPGAGDDQTNGNDCIWQNLRYLKYLYEFLGIGIFSHNLAE